MIVISWNIRGINAPTKNHMLKIIISREKLIVVLLHENKCDKEMIIITIEKILNSCKVITVVVIGFSRGLAIIWGLDRISLENSGIDQPSLCGLLSIQGTITNVYGPTNPTLKLHFHKSLKALGKLTLEHHWLVGDDFNMFTSL